MKQFTNLYQLTKTLKFQLEPQGETKDAKITKIFQLPLCPAILFANFPWINKRYERKFGYLNYFTYLRAAFLKKPRSLLC